MLEIHERKDTSGYENIISSIKNTDGSSVHIVESIDGKDENKKNGYGVYSVGEKGIKVYDFDGSNLEISDGVIRTILFKGMLGGINYCEFSVFDEGKNKKLKTLGFINENNNVIEDINIFMSSCKNCKKSK